LNAWQAASSFPSEIFATAALLVACPQIWNAPKVIAMLDVVMIVLGVGFFIASVLYVLACERM
jgi:hypothetical protein